MMATRKRTIRLDKTVEASGQSRLGFPPGRVRRGADILLIDRLNFSLTEEAFTQFTSTLDEPPKKNPGLKRLLGTRAPWER
jgi:uncharacterized protein (DUF1778 family)